MEPLAPPARPTAMTALRVLLAALLAAVGLVVLTPVASYACSCAISSEAQHESWADTVFTGTLTDVAPPPEREGGLVVSSDPATYRFTVQSVEKGEAGLVTDVRSAQLGASCGLERMKAGALYVVYATDERDGLWSGLCSGTHPVAAAPPESARVSAVAAVLRAVGLASLLPA